MLVVVLTASLLYSAAEGSFSPDFNAFLIRLYGVEAQRLLERLDFREEGSFGGRTEANETIEREVGRSGRMEEDLQPVVIVHGITNMASRFERTRNFLKSKGYTEAEVAF